MANWTNPKLDWNPGDGIKASDLNRIEGNIENLLRGCFDIGGSVWIQSTDWVLGHLPRPPRPITNYGRRLINVPVGCKLVVTQLDIDDGTESPRLQITAGSTATVWAAPSSTTTYTAYDSENAPILYTAVDKAQIVAVQLEATAHQWVEESRVVGDFTEDGGRWKGDKITGAFARLLVVNA
jgi:hypothetical protein